ncbi:MAG TPA: hypothetical protein VGO11_24655 [Chthoniobacteraceae bacterium]|jgi:hypothetical protein|nr:hypothetical protein [Chthoniobacteraceae bacterium]
MKLQHIAILTGTLFSLAVPRPGRATDVLLEQIGNITINPGSGPAELTLKGPALGGSGTAPGFTIGTAEQWRHPTAKSRRDDALVARRLPRDR